MEHEGRPDQGLPFLRSTTSFRVSNHANFDFSPGKHSCGLSLLPCGRHGAPLTFGQGCPFSGIHAAIRTPLLYTSALIPFLLRRRDGVTERAFRGNSGASQGMDVVVL
jgi:hypothetical protein